MYLVFFIFFRTFGKQVPIIVAIYISSPVTLAFSVNILINRSSLSNEVNAEPSGRNL